MKNRKRALSLLLSLVLVLGLAVPAMAAEENYFTQKGLKVQQEPPTGGTPFTFAIYDNTVERKDAAYSLEQGDFYVESCTAAPGRSTGRPWPWGSWPPPCRRRGSWWPWFSGCWCSEQNIDGKRGGKLPRFRFLR